MNLIREKEMNCSSQLGLGSVQPSRKKQAFYRVSLFLVKIKCQRASNIKFEVGWDLAFGLSSEFSLLGFS